MLVSVQKMAKKKNKSEPFDNSISKISQIMDMTSKPIPCPYCGKTLQFMYARKKTEDEIFFCSPCQIIVSIKIEINIITSLMNNLNDE